MTPRQVKRQLNKIENVIDLLQKEIGVLNEDVISSKTKLGKRLDKLVTDAAYTKGYIIEIIGEYEDSMSSL